MRWYFEQLRRFLFGLKGHDVSLEETVAVDQHQAWNLKVMSQQNDIERLQAALRDSEAEKAKLQADVETLLRERDEWKASSLRMQLNREFKNTVETLSADQKRFLKHGQHTSLPDFEQSLRQQIQLMETDAAKIWRGEVEHHVPAAMSTFSRYADIRSP
jgi:chromosome segregation ATPase